MGGIAAIYTWDAPVDLMLLTRLQRAISHRGTSVDQWSKGPVGLAMSDWASTGQTGTLLGRECWIAADARLESVMNFTCNEPLQGQSNAT